MTSQDIILIIGALALAITQIITAGQGRAQVKAMQDIAVNSADRADGKLDAIHTLTNSNLKTAKDEAAAVRADLSLANNRIANLEALLKAVVEKSEHE